MKKNTYSSSEKTRKKILSAASDLFAKKGFAAASISMIAKQAEINQSLIYHHFGSKEKLWKAVKQEIVQSMGKEGLKLEVNSLEDLLRECFARRLDLYADHPKLARLMDWQKMQKGRDKLTGGTQASPDQWRPIIEKLQKEGKINPTLSPDLIRLLLEALSSGAVSEDYDKKLKNRDNRQKYIDLVMPYLKKILA